VCFDLKCVMRGVSSGRVRPARKASPGKAALNQLAAYHGRPPWSEGRRIYCGFDVPCWRLAQSCPERSAVYFK